MRTTPSKTFLVCHGAWSAGWAWKKMHPLMQAAGHRLVTPTYTGLGERAHLANASIDLNSHIEDMLNVIRYEDLRDIVLIGHSYGGMVATGVAAFASWGMATVLPGHDDPSHLLALLRLVLVGGANVLVFLVLARLMRLTEVNEVIDTVTRRLRRPSSTP